MAETPPPATRQELNDAGSYSSRSTSGPLAGLLHVSGLTLVSRVFGLVRDAAMAASFGNGPILDAFTVAFRLPNVTRRLFGEAAFSTAFLPVFVREQHEGGRDAGWKLATAILVVTAAAVSAVTLVAVLVFAGLALLAGPGESRLLFGLTAALFPYQIFVCVTAQAAAVLHAHRRFSLPAVLPIVGNVVWLAVMAAAVWTFESDVTRIYAISAGVVFAGVLQLAITLPALRSIGFRYHWDWPAARPRVREIAITILPVLAGLSVLELNNLVDGLFAWLLTAPADAVSPDPLRYPLEPGTAAALYLGQRLYQFPLGVFGVALGTVLFPQLARHAATGRRDELSEDLSLGLRLSVGIGLPASAGLVVTAEPLAEALFRYGAFDAADSAQTAASIAGYGAGVWAFIALLILNRGFYAVADRMTPLRTGLAATAANIVFSVALAWPFGALGLALGTAIAASFQVVLSILALRGRDLSPAGWPLAIATFKAALATAAMVPVCLLLKAAFETGGGPLQRTIAVVVPVAGGVATYAVMVWLLRFRELWLLLPQRKTPADEATLL